MLRRNLDFQFHSVSYAFSLDPFMGNSLADTLRQVLPVIREYSSLFHAISSYMILVRCSLDRVAEHYELQDDYCITLFPLFTILSHTNLD